MIKIVGVGDIMPGGLLHGTNKKFISDAVLALMKDGDIRVGTLECAIGNTPDFIEEKMSRYGDVIYAPDVDLERLKIMNINIVSLANNHFFDLKESGARHTIAMLGGREHTFETTIWCYQMANKMLKAGADLILGGHTHRVQSVVNKQGKSIAFSMGNFCFPDRLIAPPLRSTYYTEDKVELDKLPVTYRYPAVEELTYKIWIPLARYGMIVSANISNGKVKSNYRLTHIDENNFIDFAERNAEIERGLSKYHFLLKYTPYRYTIPLKNKMGALVNRLRNTNNKQV